MCRSISLEEAWVVDAKLLIAKQCQRREKCLSHVLISPYHIGALKYYTVAQKEAWLLPYFLYSFISLSKKEKQLWNSSPHKLFTLWKSSTWAYYVFLKSNKCSCIQKSATFHSQTGRAASVPFSPLLMAKGNWTITAHSGVNLPISNTPTQGPSILDATCWPYEVSESTCPRLKVQVFLLWIHLR